MKKSKKYKVITRTYDFTEDPKWIDSGKNPEDVSTGQISEKEMLMKIQQDRADNLLLLMVTKVVDEYKRASKLHGPFNSPHEGYGVIKEEFDEMWKCIMDDEVDHSRREAMQLAAMGLRYLIDIKPDPKSP